MASLSNLDLACNTDMSGYKTYQNLAAAVSRLSGRRSFPYGDQPPPEFYTLIHRPLPQDDDDDDDSKPVIPLGYVRRAVTDALLTVPESLSSSNSIIIDHTNRTVRLFNELATEAERTEAIARVMRRWREQAAFPILAKWRDEPFPVYGADDPRASGALLYSVERAAAGLLGVMRYGVHMTAWVRRDPDLDQDASNYDMKIWVPRRAANNGSYPSMLDNTVAGGLTTGEDPFEAMVREADEEASLPQGLMRECCKELGTVSYIYVTDERSGGEAGLVYPETQWVYEMELPRDTVPRPKDGEVAEFYLWTVEKVQEAMKKGEFKPNCALVLLDFFVRRGIVTREKEGDYDEIVRRMHRRMPFPGPHHRVKV